MNTHQWFTLIEIAPQEEFLRFSPEERLNMNNAMANRAEVLEEFMNELARGWAFIKPQHGNPS